MKKMWKSAISILTAVSMCVGLSACGSSGGTSTTAKAPADLNAESKTSGTSSSGDKVKIKLNTSWGENSSVQEGALKFKELVEEASGGRIEVAVYPSNQLASGNQQTAVEMVQNGDIEAALFGMTKQIKLKDLWNIFVEAAVSTAVVMFIIATASVFAYVLTTNGVPQMLSGAIISMTSNKILLLLLMNIILLFAGCFLDSGSCMYIFIPILLPIVKFIGYDPVVFGVVATVNLAIGMATPPVGLDLYVACNASGVTLKSISVQTLRFVAASLVVLVLLTYLPQITTFLPSVLNIK